jgi:hypothetical protein
VIGYFIVLFFGTPEGVLWVSFSQLVCRLDFCRRFIFFPATFPTKVISALGHSQPIHSAPVQNNVRYASNSDQNIALH